MYCTACTFITPSITVSLTQIFIRCGQVHHLLTCPHLKQPQDVFIQCPMHLWPVHFIIRVSEHSGRFIRASCWLAAYQMCARVSDVILVPSTNIHSGSRENGSCCGISVMSCERIIAFAPASHAAFNWASLESSSHRMRSSWFPSTWINSRWKERPPQLTSIIFSTLECLHLMGM
jgi:hypothetical protein